MKNLKKYAFGFVALLFMAFALVTLPLTAAAEIDNKLPFSDGIQKIQAANPGMVVNGPVALNRMAEKELIKNFRHENTFMSVIPSKNKWVNNDIIDLTEIGADPAVLIDNNTYPINTASRVDGGIVIKLKKFETENTKVTDDELNALPYDKMGSVQQQHRLTLEEETAQYSLHSLCAFEDTANTPVMETTGSDDGTGRKRLTAIDVINYKKKLDKLKIPKNGRILVLSSEHTADLLIEDLTFKTRYQNTTSGVIAKNYYGFTVYEHTYNPVFADGTLQKKAYNAVGASDDRNASTVFLAQKSAKATGTAKRYLRDAATDPEKRESVVGFRIYHIAIPMQLLGTGAIIDGRV